MHGVYVFRICLLEERLYFFAGGCIVFVQPQVVLIAVKEKTNSDFALTLAKLNAEHDQMVARVHELEAIDRDTRAKQQAAHAISAAGTALNATNSTSFDATRAKMLAKNDVANAQFDSAMGSIPSTGEANSDDIDALLASLKQPELATA